MTDPLIRAFAWSDVPAITGIYRHYVEHSTATFDTEAPSATYMAEKFGHMVDLGHPVLSLEIDGALAGYAYASVYRPRPAYRFTCEDSIYLAPDLQGRGHGSLLLARLIELSRLAGFRQMLAVITSESAGSIALHRKFGFSPRGEFPSLGCKFDRWLAVTHMQLALEGAEAVASPVR